MFLSAYKLELAKGFKLQLPFPKSTELSGAEEGGSDEEKFVRKTLFQSGDQKDYETKVLSKEFDYGGSDGDFVIPRCLKKKVQVTIDPCFALNEKFVEEFNVVNEVTAIWGPGEIKNADYNLKSSSSSSSFMEVKAESEEDSKGDKSKSKGPGSDKGDKSKSKGPKGKEEESEEEGEGAAADGDDEPGPPESLCWSHLFYPQLAPLRKALFPQMKKKKIWLYHIVQEKEDKCSAGWDEDLKKKEWKFQLPAFDIGGVSNLNVGLILKGDDDSDPPWTVDSKDVRASKIHYPTKELTTDESVFHFDIFNLLNLEKDRGTKRKRDAVFNALKKFFNAHPDKDSLANHGFTREKIDLVLKPLDENLVELEGDKDESYRKVFKIKPEDEKKDDFEGLDSWKQFRMFWNQGYKLHITPLERRVVQMVPGKFVLKYFEKKEVREAFYEKVKKMVVEAGLGDGLAKEEDIEEFVREKDGDYTKFKDAKTGALKESEKTTKSCKRWGEWLDSEEPLAIGQTMSPPLLSKEEYTKKNMIGFMKKGDEGDKTEIVLNYNWGNMLEHFELNAEGMISVENVGGDGGGDAAADEAASEEGGESSQPKQGAKAKAKGILKGGKEKEESAKPKKKAFAAAASSFLDQGLKPPPKPKKKSVSFESDSDSDYSWISVSEKDKSAADAQIQLSTKAEQMALKRPLVKF